jgi:glucose/arabinose dehydrogenase
MVTLRSFLSLALTTALLVFLAGCAGTQDATQSTSAETPTDEWITLFDGMNLDGWTQAGPGQFTLQDDGTMQSQGGMGLFYYNERPFRDYVLELDWKVENDSANSGLFLRFPEQTDDPWYAVENGYEIQIDGSAPDPINRTGAVYDISAPFKQAAKPAGEWNTYRIKVTGQRYEVFLNGEKVNDFFGDRGREGYIGVQNHDPNSTTWFRNIRVQPLPDENYPTRLAELYTVPDERDPVRVLMVTATHGFRHGPAIETAKNVVAELETTTEFQFDVTEDLNDLTTENLSRYDLLFLNNATLRTPAGAEEDEAASSESVWRGYDVALQTPEGTMNGRIMLYGEPGSLSGTIAFEQQPAPGSLEDVEYDNGNLTFHFTVDQYGRFDGDVRLVDGSLEGTLAMASQGGYELDLTGDILTDSALASDDESAETVSPDQQAAIIDFVANGGGFVGAHAALDAFYNLDAYRAMVGGGLFEEHPWTQSVAIKVEEPDNPAMQHFGDSFWIRDEIYVLDENPRWNARVLASLDMNSVGITQGHADQTRDDYPISWIRNHENGRVFITKLGHFPDVWRTPAFVTHLLEGMRMAAGRTPADFSGHREKDVIADNVWPDDIAVDEQSNVWIAELRGKVHHYDAAADTTRLIAELETTDPTNIEHGLYGIEVDPNFYNGEPYVYMYYAEPETFINTLARFRYENGELDLGSREILLRVPTEPQCCHQAGDLEWGPDGTLYLSTGDTGMSETRPEWELTQDELQAFMDEHDLNDYHWSRLVDSERSAQNLQDLRGKILRINKDGTIPKDNPFYGEPGVRWEIYAYGLRNPYRFKVDPQTGAMYIGVVGPDASFDYDEYVVATEGGENFGWPRSIGKLFYNEITPDDIPNYVPPMWEYTYQTGGRSATVGPIYRHEGPGGFASAFQDKVFLYDWARRWIKWADIDDLTFESDTSASVKRTPQLVTMPAKRYTNIKTFDQLTTTTPISMELGPDGALYLAEFTGFWDPAPGARVTRYRWVTDDVAASQASAKPVPGSKGQTFRFDATPAPSSISGFAYEWAFGDGATSTAAHPTHTYDAPGAYTVQLTVTEADGTVRKPVAIEVIAGDNPHARTALTTGQ